MRFYNRINNKLILLAIVVLLLTNDPVHSYCGGFQSINNGEAYVWHFGYSEYYNSLDCQEYIPGIWNVMIAYKTEHNSDYVDLINIERLTGNGVKLFKNVESPNINFVSDSSWDGYDGFAAFFYQCPRCQRPTTTCDTTTSDTCPKITYLSNGDALWMKTDYKANLHCSAKLHGIWTVSGSYHLNSNDRLIIKDSTSMQESGNYEPREVENPTVMFQSGSDGTSKGFLIKFTSNTKSTDSEKVIKSIIKNPKSSTTVITLSVLLVLLFVAMISGAIFITIQSGKLSFIVDKFRQNRETTTKKSKDKKQTRFNIYYTNAIKFLGNIKSKTPKETKEAESPQEKEENHVQDVYYDSDSDVYVGDDDQQEEEYEP